jgi:hypothetical protein
MRKIDRRNLSPQVVQQTILESGERAPSRKEKRKQEKESRDTLKTNESLVSIQKKIEEMNKKNGLISFTNSFKNIPMWSHYAHSHTGICIGFDKEILESKLRNSVEHTIVLHNINYSDIYPIIGVSKYREQIKSLYQKSTDWKYENEFRAILKDRAKNLIDIKGSVVEIYLGSRFIAKSREVVSKYASDPTHKNVKFYRLENDENSYKLNRNRIEVKSGESMSDCINSLNLPL